VPALDGHGLVSGIDHSPSQGLATVLFFRRWDRGSSPTWGVSLLEERRSHIENFLYVTVKGRWGIKEEHVESFYQNSR
jgi:hypothetical protein